MKKFVNSFVEKSFPGDNGQVNYLEVTTNDGMIYSYYGDKSLIKIGEETPEFTERITPKGYKQMVVPKPQKPQGGNFRGKSENEIISSAITMCLSYSKDMEVACVGNYSMDKGLVNEPAVLTRAKTYVDFWAKNYKELKEGK